MKMSALSTSASNEQSSVQGTEPAYNSDDNEHRPPDDFDLGNMDPHPDWRFNNFLLDLENEISDDELRKLKELFRDIIGNVILNEMQSATELFTILRHSRKISRDNLLYLQAIIRKLQRPELVQMALQYARDEGNCLHFYEASEFPENGFKYVKFHVEGKDFKTFSRPFLFRIRNIVSEILLVPPQYVIIAGVEPSSSMLITLMIPELYVSALQTLAQDNLQDLHELSDLGIDWIAIDDKSFNIHGVTDAEVVETEQQAKLVSVYQDLNRTKKQLEEREVECLKLTRRVNDFEKQQFQSHVETNVLRKMFGEVTQSEPINESTLPANLASQSSLVLFKESLRQIEERQYDRRIIGQLLAANTDVVVTRMKDGCRIKTQRLELALQDLQSQLVPQQLENLSLSLLVDHNKVSEILLEFLKQLRELLRVDMKVTPFEIEVLKKITRKLRQKERHKLIEKYKWPDDDLLKTAKDDDPDLLLACILLKEVEQTQQEVDFESFISKCLMEVGRSDLKKKFLEMINRRPMWVKPVATAPPAQQTHTAGFVTGKPSGNVDMVKMSEQVEDMHEKVGRMDAIMRKSQLEYDDVFKDSSLPKSCRFDNTSSSAWQSSV